MSASRKMGLNSSGQALLIVMAILTVLLIALTASFFTSQTGTLHQSANTQNTQGQSTAEDGIAYAIQQLSVSSMTWQNALNGIFPAGCNSPNFVTSASGGHFLLSCSTGTAGNPNLQPYEVAVKAVASVTGGNGTEIPTRAMQAYLSQRTLGVDFATTDHAAAALEMSLMPNISGTLDVEWGPIVCWDAGDTWLLPSPLDAGRFPRKFSVGAITGGSYARSASGLKSDQKEYWAYASQMGADVPLINETYYIQQAQNATGITPPKYPDGTTINPTGCLPFPTNTTCGYFVTDPQHVGGNTAIFDGIAPGYQVLPGGINSQVIYVNGPATQFNNLAIDSATFITTGSLTITSAGGGNPLTLKVPIYAPVEYPFSPPTPAVWPCQGQQGNTCASAGNVQFRGFLYVKGNLTVNVPTPGWTMAGVLLVGDPQAPPGSGYNLNIPVGDGLTLMYDDGINHSIRVNPLQGISIKVEPDLLQDIPTS